MAYYTRILGEASNSGLKEFRISPLSYLEWCNGANKPTTKPMRDGTAFHLALHKPDEFARTYYVLPKTILNSLTRKQVFADSTLGELAGIGYLVSKDEDAETLRDNVSRILGERGIFVIERPELDTMHQMIDSLNKPCHAQARALVLRGSKELELRWADEESGISCKALLDSWDDPIRVESDLKRTTNITVGEMSRDTRNRGYDFQRAWYRRALVANGHEVHAQFLVCGCPEPPYLWAVYSVPEDRIQRCDEILSENLRELRRCIDTNEWSTINNGAAVELQMRANW